MPTLKCLGCVCVCFVIPTILETSLDLSVMAGPTQQCGFVYVLYLQFIIYLMYFHVVVRATQVAFAVLLNSAFPWHDFIMDEREKPVLENVREMINVRCVRTTQKYQQIKASWIRPIMR